MGCGGSKAADATAKPVESQPEKVKEQSVSTAAAESKNDVPIRTETVSDAPMSGSDETPSSKARTSNNTPFSGNPADGEQIIVTSQPEDHNSADSADDRVGGLTINPAAESMYSIQSVDPSEGLPVVAEEEESNFDASVAVAPPASPPAPMVKRTSVKDRIKRVNSMERRSTSGRYAPDSPLTSSKLEYDYLIKLAILGDLAVGKSSLQMQFVEDTYKSWYKSTIGTEFKFKSVVAATGHKLKMQCWDTSGKERLQGTSPEFFQKMLGFMLVYDVTNEESFQNIKTAWYKKTLLPAGTAHSDLVVRLLVGNKANEAEYEEGVTRKVSFEQGEELAKEMGADGTGVIFVEASAKTGDSVMAAFMALANEIVYRIQANGAIYEKYKQTLY